MIGSKRKSLKEDILEILLHREMSSKDLLPELANIGYKVTIQAIYKQLNILIEDGVVIKNKQCYIVSNEWRRSIASLLDIRAVSLPELGERFNYKFVSLVHLDSYWKHIVNAIMYMYPESSTFSYCPHQIWPYVPQRMESERNMAQIHENINQYNYFILGGNTELDKKYRRVFSKKFFKVELLPNIEVKRHVHMTVIGNIIVSSHIDKNIAQSIDTIYASHTDIKEQVKNLVPLLEQEQSCKIIIENNPKKAEIYRKRYSQPFAII